MAFPISTDQIGGVARAFLGPTLAYGAAKGVLPAGDYDWLAAGLSAAVVALWSAWTNRPAKLAPRA